MFAPEEDPSEQIAVGWRFRAVSCAGLFPYAQANPGQIFLVTLIAHVWVGAALHFDDIC